MLKRLPYIVLYLTRSGITESSPELADVLYQYPTAASGHHSIKLLKVRLVKTTVDTGMFPQVIDVDQIDTWTKNCVKCD